MEQEQKDLRDEIIKILKEGYKGIERIVTEDDGVLCIYAPDDILWKILEDNMGKLNLEFEAGANEPHFLKIII